MMAEKVYNEMSVNELHDWDAHFTLEAEALKKAQQKRK